MLLNHVKDQIVTPYLLRELDASAFRIYQCLRNRRISSLLDNARYWGIPRETFRVAVRRLIEMGWVITIRKSERRHSLYAWMPIQVEEEVAKELARRLQYRSYFGEWLMRCFLDLSIDDEVYEDNARPPWLVAGDGGRPLELDRWYERAGVAFEFQGAQHYRAGDLSSESEVLAQRTRDNIKAGICARNGIHVVEITPLDLNIGSLRSKIGTLLPWRPVFEERPVYRVLQQLSHSYSNSVARQTQREVRRQQLEL